MMKYKLLGNSGVRVSEICLGTMTFGSDTDFGCDYETSKKIFDVYVNKGGNFIDTANIYTAGNSEMITGDLVRSDRDHFVLATKYTLFDKKGDPNFSGNHRKNMMRSIEGSLKRLNTEYIDLFWVHAWDFTTHVEEVMRGLDDLVSQGKVNYIGVSDTPAWIIAKANTVSDFRGWSKFCALQIEYSLTQRTPERDLLPMAKEFDLAVTSWAPLAGGALTGKYLKNEQGRVPEHSLRRNEKSTTIAKEVVKIAEELGKSPAQVALNWNRQKEQIVIPIIGARKAEQIEDSLGCLVFTLSEEEIKRLDEVSKIELGFPHDMLASEQVKEVSFGGTHSQIENHRNIKSK